MVEACVSAYAQTVAQCPGDHWRSLGNGGRERVSNSDLSRILRQPNDYQHLRFPYALEHDAQSVPSRGEAFGIVIRNNRGEVDEIHLMLHNGIASVAADGSIFYGLQGNEIAEARYNLGSMIPARDVLHVRLHTPVHPLRGVSPILAATLDLAMSGAALSQQVAFYLNQAGKPSFILETDLELNKTQAARGRNCTPSGSRKRQAPNAGGTPLLSWGLKANQVTASAADGQLAEMRKLNDQSVALAFRMPLQVLGVGGTPFASTEALMQSWISQGLGFCLVTTSRRRSGCCSGCDGVPDEYVEFDTRAFASQRVQGSDRGSRRAA